MARKTIPALRVLGGPAAGRVISFDRPGVDITIGRDQAPAGVSFEDDDALSRRHARFQLLASGAVLVEDLASSNGTEVNGQRIDIPRLLALGDEVRVGGTTVRLERIVPEPAAPAQAVRPVGPAGPVEPAEPAAALGSVAPATLPPPPEWATARTVLGGGRPVTRTGPGHRALVAVAAVFVVAVALAFVAGTRVGGHSSSAAPTSELPPGTGMVYLESGRSEPGANAIIAFHYRAGGDLHPLDIKEVPTGGAAGFDLTNTGALDADGQIVASADGRLLFAVNQGSDTIAVFHVLADGSLRAVAGSPFPSGGMAPGGLAVSGRQLIVVNKAQDGIRDLSLVAPNVTSFLVAADGSLRRGSTVPGRPGSSPTEALVTPDGQVVVVPQEHGPFLSLILGTDGQLTSAPGSPVPLPDAIFPPSQPRGQRWALGLAAQPRGGTIYAEVVDTAALVVYQYTPAGQLRFVRAVADPGANLPCWSLLNASGTRLYTDNAGNNTMSVFNLDDPLRPHQIQVVTLKNSGNPWDLRMDPSGRYIFVLDARDREDLVAPGGGNELHTLVVNPDGTLTEPEYSPVPIPVPLNTNPIGLAVVGH